MHLLIEEWVWVEIDAKYWKIYADRRLEVVPTLAFLQVVEMILGKMSKMVTCMTSSILKQES